MLSKDVGEVIEKHRRNTSVCAGEGPTGKAKTTAARRSEGERIHPVAFLIVAGRKEFCMHGNRTIADFLKRLCAWAVRLRTCVETTMQSGAGQLEGQPVFATRAAVPGGTTGGANGRSPPGLHGHAKRWRVKDRDGRQKHSREKRSMHSWPGAVVGGDSIACTQKRRHLRCPRAPG